MIRVKCSLKTKKVMKMSEKRYDQSKDIPEEVIKKAFVDADLVIFSARRFNYVKYRFISFGGLGWWLPLSRVLPLIGITPEMLKPVFFPQQRRIKRRFPFSLAWFGLNKKQYKFVEVELEKVENYDQLGNFPLAYRPFQDLAKVLGKRVKVLREDGGTGECCYLFTTHPSNDVVDVALE